MNRKPPLSQPTELSEVDLPQPEARMREALGLRNDGTRTPATPNNRPERALDHSSGTPRRHRFVQEGEVPVEVMTLGEHTDRSTLSTLGIRRRGGDVTALAAERNAREHAERALAEATNRMRDLQTKLGHAELARDEALELVSQRQVQIQTLQDELRDAATRKAVPGAACTRTDTQVVPPVTQRLALPKPPKSVTAPLRARREPAPKPVKWWVKKNP
jgi:hypothetical protein